MLSLKQILSVFHIFHQVVRLMFIIITIRYYDIYDLKYLVIFHIFHLVVILMFIIITIWC